MTRIPAGRDGLIGTVGGVANILQSPEWAQFQESIGHRVVQAEGPGWRYLATVEGGRTGRYLYCPYGPEAETPQAFDLALADLEHEDRRVRNAHFRERAEGDRLAFDYALREGPCPTTNALVIMARAGLPVEEPTEAG